MMQFSKVLLSAVVLTLGAGVTPSVASEHEVGNIWWSVEDNTTAAIRRFASRKATMTSRLRRCSTCFRLAPTTTAIHWPTRR